MPDYSPRKSGFKLLCTTTHKNPSFQSRLDSVNSHRITMWFATRIGIDGNTPYIGSNGNWWIGDQDLGVSVHYVHQFPSLFEFPVVGRENHLYIAMDKNKSYRWDSEKMYYYVVGSDYEDIKLINGGNAEL